MNLIRIFRFLLFPVSWIYLIITSVRNVLYNKRIFSIYESSIPTISIGNISVGGTGKTPMSEYLMQWAQGQGLTAAYLSRGYGRKSKGFHQVDPATGDASIYGDEALQVAVKFPDFPVAVSEDRRVGMKKLEALKPDLILLDDAFQHRKVGRDLDLLMIDANRLPYRDFVLPTGSLRESIQGIKRADLLIVNKIQDESQIADIKNRLNKWGKGICFSRFELGKVQGFWGSEIQQEKLDQRSQEVLLFSGIGNPNYFEQLINENGWKLSGHIRFGDHHDFALSDIEKLLSSRKGDEILLCTEKDYSRLKGKGFFSKLKLYPFFYVPITLHFMEGKELLIEKLQGLNLG